MSNGLNRYLSPLEKVELRLGLKLRIRFLGTCGPKTYSDIKDNIARCARLYARLRGIEPHNNPMLIEAQSVELPGNWYKSKVASFYRKEI